MTALDKFSKYIESHPDGPKAQESQVILGLEKAARQEDVDGTWKLLWQRMMENNRWSYWCLMALSNRDFRARMTDEEYQSLEPLISNEDPRWRSGVGMLLGETVRWPNPLLLRLITQETEVPRSGLLGYLFAAAGVSVAERMRLSDKLDATPGLITEQMILDALQQYKNEQLQA